MNVEQIDAVAVNDLAHRHTVAELLAAAHMRASFMADGDRSPAGREFALAKTAIEDARMRFNRGLAVRQDRFLEVDLEKHTPNQETTP